jgi:hypothetical protein
MKWVLPLVEHIGESSSWIVGSNTMVRPGFGRGIGSKGNGAEGRMGMG